MFAPFSNALVRYAAAALPLALLFLKPNWWRLSTTVLFTLGFAVQVAAYLMLAKQAQPIVQPPMVLMNAALTGVGALLNVLALLFDRPAAKSSKRA